MRKLLSIIVSAILCLFCTTELAKAVAATGGTVTTNLGYIIHTFTNSGTFTVTDGGKVEVLVVAAGGGGPAGTSNVGSGGGGGGSIQYSNNYTLISGSMSVTVGVCTAVSSNGGNSSFGTIVATGGGAGGGATANGGNGSNGGSGGGSAGSNRSAGTGSQGFNGGTGVGTYGGSNVAGGGGGGNGSIGSNAVDQVTAGVGGIGTVYSVSGSNVTYAAGGNGAPFSRGSAGIAGVAGTGNGGGGGAGSGTTTGALGGSGIVIVKYAITYPDFSTWVYKSTITFSGYSPTEILTNFPALVQLGTNIIGYNPSQSLCPAQSGCDVRFMASDGITELNYEKELWSTSLLTNSIFWVQVPLLTNGASIIAYWGKSTTSPAYTTNGATWDNSHVGVWHLPNGTTLTANDSTTNAMNGAVSNVVATTGVVDGAGRFTGAPRYINLGLNKVNTKINGKSAITLSAWVKPATTNQQRVINFVNGDGLTGGMIGFQPGVAWVGARSKSTDSFQFTTFTAPDTNVWSHFVGIANFGTALLSIYINGTLVKTQNVSWGSSTFVASVNSSGTPDNSDTLGVYAPTPTDYFRGSIDEARISSVSRSSNWVWACYQNMASNTAFQTYGMATLTSPQPINYGFVKMYGSSLSGIIGGSINSIMGYSGSLNANITPPTRIGTILPSGLGTVESPYTYIFPSTLGLIMGGYSINGNDLPNENIMFNMNGGSITGSQSVTSFDLHSTSNTANLTIQNADKVFIGSVDTSSTSNNAGSVSISAFEDIVISGAVMTAVSGTAGTLALTNTSVTAPITISSLNLSNHNIVSLSAGSSNIVITTVSNFTTNRTSGAGTSASPFVTTQTKLRVPAGQIINYDRNAAGNTYLGAYSYKLADVNGNAASGGLLTTTDLVGPYAIRMNSVTNIQYTDLGMHLYNLNGYVVRMLVNVRTNSVACYTGAKNAGNNWDYYIGIIRAPSIRWHCAAANARQDGPILPSYPLGWWFLVVTNDAFAVTYLYTNSTLAVTANASTYGVTGANYAIGALMDGSITGIVAASGCPWDFARIQVTQNGTIVKDLVATAYGTFTNASDGATYTFGVNGVGGTGADSVSISGQTLPVQAWK